MIGVRQMPRSDGRLVADIATSSDQTDGRLFARSDSVDGVDAAARPTTADA